MGYNNGIGLQPIPAAANFFGSLPNRRGRFADKLGVPKCGVAGGERKNAGKSTVGEPIGGGSRKLAMCDRFPFDL
jgi:hypothetical protein